MRLRVSGLPRYEAVTRSYNGFRLSGVRRARKYERQRAFLEFNSHLLPARTSPHAKSSLVGDAGCDERKHSCWCLLSTAVRVGHDCAWRCHQHVASTQRWLLYTNHTYFQTFDSSLCTEVYPINGRTQYALDHVSLKGHNRGGSLNTTTHDHP